MEVFDECEVFARLCNALDRPGIFLRLPRKDAAGNRLSLNEVRKAVPFLDLDEHLQFFADGLALIICQDEKEQLRLYELTVGDDGPTKRNKYNGSARVYALTCSRDGKFENENTYGVRL